MLVDVQSFVFYSGWDTETMHFLDAIEEDETAGCCPKVDNENAEALCSEEVPAMTVESTIGGREQAREQGAQNAANAMDRTCANWVVDVEAMVDKLNGAGSES